MDDAAADVLCQRGWIAHEQQRANSSACAQSSHAGARHGGAICSALRALAGRSLFFYGDSLLRQQFHQLLCTCRRHVMLESASHAYWRCDPDLPGVTPAYARKCLHNSTSIALRPGPPERPERRVWLHWAYTPGTWLREAAWSQRREAPAIWASGSEWLSKLRAADVVVFGVGAWWAQFGVAEWNASLWSWTAFLDSHVRYENQRVWLEYFAGHFASSTGEWSKEAKRATRCAPVAASAAAQWPGRIAAEAWARASRTRIWRVAEASLPRHDDHPGSLGLQTSLWIGNLPVALLFDCRHFCFPGATLAARNRALVELLRGTFL